MARRLKQILLALFLINFLLGASSLQAREHQLNDLDKYIEKARKDWEIPGLAVAIVKDDSLIFAKGYGIKEIGKKGEVDEHTLFAIASNTKAFTASLLGMLIEEDKLDWDDRVIDYIPNFHMYDPYVTREITIRDLLTHRSGLPTFGGDHIWIGNAHNREEIILRLRHLKPSASFRSKYQYQNLMFLVAGQIIPAVSGQSWDDAIEERIFKPLGMNESNTSVRYLKGTGNVAAPHEMVEGKLIPIAYDNVDAIAPAGAINSNVVDMAKWMRFNLKGGQFEGEQIFSPEVIKELHTTQFPLKVSSFSEENFATRFAGYGLGWGVWDYKGYKVLSHGGGLSGMISYQILLPEIKLGVLILTNFAPNRLARALSYRIVDAFLGEPERDWSADYLKRREEEKEKKNKAEKELQSERVKGTKPSLTLKEYAGNYYEDFSGIAEVKFENDKLIFDYNPRYIGVLEHWHYDTFRVHWRHPIFDMEKKTFLTFYLDETGIVAGLKITFYDPIHFKRETEAE
ncbi:MAG: serine hydrolase [bacterium]|nr:MAG: serine hydrolase [bacterium]